MCPQLIPCCGSSWPERPFRQNRCCQRETGAPAGYYPLGVKPRKTVRRKDFKLSTWHWDSQAGKADDDGRDMMAPVVLLPVQAKRNGHDESAIEIQLIGEAKAIRYCFICCQIRSTFVSQKKSSQNRRLRVSQKLLFRNRQTKVTF